MEGRVPTDRSRKRTVSKPLGIDVSDYEGGLAIESAVLPQPVEPQQETVSVILLKDKIVKVTGKYTGRLYVFNGAGSVVDNVDKNDADDMLQKGLNASCCGTYSTPYFQLVGR